MFGDEQMVENRKRRRVDVPPASLMPSYGATGGQTYSNQQAYQAGGANAGGLPGFNPTFNQGPGANNYSYVKNEGSLATPYMNMPQHGGYTIPHTFMNPQQMQQQQQQQQQQQMQQHQLQPQLYSVMHSSVKTEPSIDSMGYTDHGDLQKDGAAAPVPAVVSSEESEDDLDTDCAPPPADTDLITSSQTPHLGPFTKGATEISQNQKHGSLETTTADSTPQEKVVIDPLVIRAQDATLRMMAFERMAEESVQNFSITGDPRYFLALLRPFMACRDEYGDNSFHLAVIHGKEEVLRDLLEIGSSNMPTALNQPNDRGQTPLHIATIVGKAGCVGMLLLHGANPFKRDDKGDTCFHVAARNRDLPTLRQLCQHHRASKSRPGQLNLKNHKGLTPLIEAVRCENLEGVQELLDFGASVNEGDGHSGMTPLHHAVEIKNIVIASHLIMAGEAHLNHQRFDNNTALHMAVEGQMVDITKLLMSAGADTDIQNDECVDEYDEDGPKCTPIDLATDKPEILSILTGSCKSKKVADHEKLSSLDMSTRNALALEMDVKSHAWKELARQLKLGNTIDHLKSHPKSPTIAILNYLEENEGTVTELKRALQNIGCDKCVTLIDSRQNTQLTESSVPARLKLLNNKYRSGVDVSVDSGVQSGVHSGMPSVSNNEF